MFSDNGKSFLSNKAEMLSLSGGAIHSTNRHLTQFECNRNQSHHRYERLFALISGSTQMNAANDMVIASCCTLNYISNSSFPQYVIPQEHCHLTSSSLLVYHQEHKKEELILRPVIRVLMSLNRLSKARLRMRRIDDIGPVTPH